MQTLRLIKNLNQLQDTLKDEISIFKKRDRVLVKVHMGEVHNKYYLKPNIIKKAVDVLKNAELKPFLFDSPAVYEGGRDSIEKYYKTAEMHGFTEKSIGCPIVISDEPIIVNTKHLNARVCKAVAEADACLILSHVKGHPCAGFGGAIKNLGMGCVSKQSKNDIHNGAKPLLTGECIACGACARYCPAQCIAVNETAEFDLDACFGCSTCALVCPKKAIAPKLATFDELLAEGAYAASSKMKKSLFVNFIIDVAKMCDCCDDAGEIVARDIGVLFGGDAVAIDTASLDLINKEKRDVFKQLHHHDPYLQLNFAEKLGIGEKEYDVS